jgi:hypothetical protein
MKDQKGKAEGSTRLVYTGLCVELEHLKIETRFQNTLQHYKPRRERRLVGRMLGDPQQTMSRFVGCEGVPTD